MLHRTCITSTLWLQNMPLWFRRATLARHDMVRGNACLCITPTHASRTGPHTSRSAPTAKTAFSAQVWRGAEDGRLMRALTRLCFVLERPESAVDPAWAETGASFCALPQHHCMGKTCEDYTEAGPVVR